MFEDFIKQGKVRRAKPDIELSRSLVKMSDANLRFASSIVIHNDNASPIFVTFYEALREICEAICSRNGFKVYSHEAFTSYLKEELKEENYARTFDRLRKLRNGINYYGEAVSKEETIVAAEDVKDLISNLKTRHLPD